MSSIIYFLIFLFITLSFGYLVCFLFLNERKISILVPFSILIGLNGYNFFVNVLSYFIPIKITIWAVLLLLTSFAVYIIFGQRKYNLAPEMDFSIRELKILFGLAVLIAVISGVVTLRALDPDDYGHLIFSSTISEGNFPVMNPMDPDSPLSYHYGPDLLAGALHKVTGMPLLRGFAVQTFIFSGLTFLLAFILAFSIFGNFYSAILAALFFFYGGGALFLNVINGFQPLYHKYILGDNVVGAWKFIADMLWPKINQFYVYAIRNHTSVMGIPIMLAVVFLYFRSIDEEKIKIVKIIIAGLLLGYLALSLETSFVLLLFVFLTVLFKEVYSLFKYGDIFCSPKDYKQD